MTEINWRFAHASVIGTSHLKNDTHCQDWAKCCTVSSRIEPETLVIVVSDGAGSATRGSRGAELTCEYILKVAASYILYGGRVQRITQQRVKHWIEGLRKKLLNTAEEEGLDLREFSCTLLCAVVGRADASFFQIGDGAIVVSQNGEINEYSWVFWPQRGEYANTTHFVTGIDSIQHLDFALVSRPVDEIAVFTDGIQSLALSYEHQTAYEPFFRPIFDTIRHAPPGFSANLSQSLATFLNSPRVNSRSDDDKTLVIATRRIISQDNAGDEPTEDTIDHENAL